jgi:hypothetical protein
VFVYHILVVGSFIPNGASFPHSDSVVEVDYLRKGKMQAISSALKSTDTTISSKALIKTLSHSILRDTSESLA